ncbi:hypothetical protein B0I00_0015 [Novosphingobium kunmingense]|uniref:Uncharacterized protein n=1 Tax=Novosphingobium kunmingense TaxID=1211806 RepID=A0A2N0I0V9_9SPHN|nr:hypothetical protein [Novosphingobium kunmingense]PKB24837.1 hypothetical protein B0I00_0015 [Novosphingobium kunmingense]
MKFTKVLLGLTLGAIVMPSIALADDPNDPDMRDPRNRARDKAIIKKLNQDQLAYVRKRDAQYAEGWRAYREQNGNVRGRGVDESEYRDSMADYQRERARYERDRAAWRRAVQLCQSGHYQYCDG